MTFSLSSRGSTDIGRVRAVNQDSYLIEDGIGLYIVADGMGGHAGGEIASKLCVKTISTALKNKIDELRSFHHTQQFLRCLRILSEAVNLACGVVYEHALEEPSLKGMGTTVTLALIIENRAYCAHVGDSRLYLWRKDYIFQMSYDHSLVNEHMRAGILSAEDAKNHHLKNVITRSVGYQEEEDVDTFSLDLEENDLILISSDGLHGKITDKELSKSLMKQGVNAVEPLIQLANQRGGEDNISVVIVKVGQ